MNSPMTTAQAEERFGCTCCLEDNCSCLLSSTCSVNCTSCGKRVWFPGYVCNKGNPRTYTCPYCGAEDRPNIHCELEV